VVFFFFAEQTAAITKPTAINTISANEPRDDINITNLLSTFGMFSSSSMHIPLSSPFKPFPQFDTHLSPAK
jgi:hypothetical protein